MPSGGLARDSPLGVSESLTPLLYPHQAALLTVGNNVGVCKEACFGGEAPFEHILC